MHRLMQFTDPLCNSSPAEALRTAQLWMLNGQPGEIKEAKGNLLGLEPGVSEITPNDCSNPANWAAFFVVGNGFAVFE